MRKPPPKTKPEPRFEVAPPTPQMHAYLIDKQKNQVILHGHPWDAPSEFSGFTKLDIVSLVQQAAKDSGLDVFLEKRRVTRENRSWNRYQKRQAALRFKRKNRRK